MKNFEYAAPRSESEVLELLSPVANHTEVLAGGTDLVGLMKSMVVQPERVVNLMEVDSFRQFGPLDDGRIQIGATVALDEILSHPYLGNYPALTQAIAGINSMQLQSQGTLGGEVCQRPQCWFFRGGHGLVADNGKLPTNGDNRYHAIFANEGPAKFVSSSRTAPALIALQAVARVIGPQSDDVQFIPIEELFRSPGHEGQRELTLAPNQVLTHVVLPPAGDTLSATYEVRQSEGPDFPLAAASVALEVKLGVVQQARVVLGQVAPTPWFSNEAAQSLIGQPIDADSAERAGEATVSRATPLGDNHYKVQLAKVAVKRAILLAAGLETGGI
jgi:xanthine dehydrogenase YagS FAD-binding subunit